MTKLVWTTKGLGLGGAEAILVDLAAELERLDWSLFVANLGDATDHSDGLRRTGIEVTEFGRSPHWPFVFRWLRELSPAVVHVNNPTTLAPLAVARLLRAIRCPIVYTEHNLWGSRRRATRTAHYLLSMVPDATIAVSDSVSASGHRWRRRLRTIYHGPPLDSVSQSAELLGDPKFVMVGGLRPNKDHRNGIQAFHAARTRLPNATLHVFGDGERRDSVEQLVDQLDLHDSVTLHGDVYNARRYLGPDCIFLQSSVAEGLPISLGEALAMGSSIVATDVGGTREALTTEEGEVVGLLCSPSDSDALSRCMVAAAESESAVWSVERRKLAASRTPAVTAAGYDELYRSVLR